ncbi:hypothetical protein HanPI659440_Chr11g0425381 [Helianthus annuus]|nr:hypothetical protein HanPI659440_Chr11g0425381 [Helianthus annuus]
MGWVKLLLSFWNFSTEPADHVITQIYILAYNTFFPAINNKPQNLGYHSKFRTVLTQEYAFFIFFLFFRLFFEFLQFFIYFLFLEGFHYIFLYGSIRVVIYLFKIIWIWIGSRSIMLDYGSDHDPFKLDH